MNDINKTSYTLMNKIISEYDQLKLVIINDSYSYTAVCKLLPPCG